MSKELKFGKNATKKFLWMSDRWELWWVLSMTSKTSKTIQYKPFETSSRLTNRLGKTNFDCIKTKRSFYFFFYLKLVSFVSLTCSHSHLCLFIFPIQQCNLIACFQNCVKIWISWAIKTSLCTRQGCIGTYFRTVEIAWGPNQKPKWFFLKNSLTLNLCV